jgi:formylglycine-generating enzyme required for sulfatase activity
MKLISSYIIVVSVLALLCLSHTTCSPDTVPNAAGAAKSSIRPVITLAKGLVSTQIDSIIMAVVTENPASSTVYRWKNAGEITQNIVVSKKCTKIALWIFLLDARHVKMAQGDTSFNGVTALDGGELAISLWSTSVRPVISSRRANDTAAVTSITSTPGDTLNLVLSASLPSIPCPVPTLRELSSDSISKYEWHVPGMAKDSFAPGPASRRIIAPNTLGNYFAGLRVTASNGYTDSAQVPVVIVKGDIQYALITCDVSSMRIVDTSGLYLFTGSGGSAPLLLRGVAKDSAFSSKYVLCQWHIRDHMSGRLIDSTVAARDSSRWTLDFSKLNRLFGRHIDCDFDAVDDDANTKKRTISIIVPGKQTVPPTIVKDRGGVLVVGRYYLLSDYNDDLLWHYDTAIVTHSFFCDTAEVTQNSFQQLMGVNPSKFRSPDRPVDSVTWCDAIRYCNARSRTEGFAKCYSWTDSSMASGKCIGLGNITCDFSVNGYRLPTRDEWMLAQIGAAVDTLENFTGDASNDATLRQYVWYDKNAGGKNSWSGTDHAAVAGTQPVATKLPNGFGIYDILGNLEEWCWNRQYENSGFSCIRTMVDFTGEKNGSQPIARGASWWKSNYDLRIKSGNDINPSRPEQTSDLTGFRVVRTAQER